MQLVGIIDGMDARKSVLLVEPGTDTYLSAMLGRCGFAVTVTPSAEIALFELGERRVDVVVATLSLPGMGTAAFCRELRRGGTAPIVVVTANDEDWVDAMALGADDHLHMPCDHRELRARLNSVIRRFRSPHSPARCVQVGGTSRGLGGD